MLYMIWPYMAVKKKIVYISRFFFCNFSENGSPLPPWDETIPHQDAHHHKAVVEVVKNMKTTWTTTFQGRLHQLMETAIGLSNMNYIMLMPIAIIFLER